MDLRQWLTFTLPNGEQVAIAADQITFFMSHQNPVPLTVIYTRQSNVTVIEPFTRVAELLGFMPPPPPEVTEVVSAAPRVVRLAQ